MEVPTFDELINPILGALHKLGGSASIGELTEEVIDDLQPPAEVVQQPHGKGNQTELEYRLAWARTYLKKYGLILNSERGVWTLTAEGAKVKATDPKDIVRFVRSQRRKQTRLISGGRLKSIDTIEGVEDAGDKTASWREYLIETLLNISPAAFERLCQRLLRESGFIEVEVTGRSGDGGIDGHGIVRVAGLISFTVLFQCK